jgi:hypothetical protein
LVLGEFEVDHLNFLLGDRDTSFTDKLYLTPEKYYLSLMASRLVRRTWTIRDLNHRPNYLQMPASGNDRADVAGQQRYRLAEEHIRNTLLQPLVVFA